MHLHILQSAFLRNVGTSSITWLRFPSVDSVASRMRIEYFLSEEFNASASNVCKKLEMYRSLKRD